MMLGDGFYTCKICKQRLEGGRSLYCDECKADGYDEWEKGFCTVCHEDDCDGCR